MNTTLRCYFFFPFQYETNNKYLIDNYHLLRCNILTLDYSPIVPPSLPVLASTLSLVEAHNHDNILECYKNLILMLPSPWSDFVLKSVVVTKIKRKRFHKESYLLFIGHFHCSKMARNYCAIFTVITIHIYRSYYSNLS